MKTERIRIECPYCNREHTYHFQTDDVDALKRRLAELEAIVDASLIPSDQEGE